MNDPDTSASAPAEELPLEPPVKPRHIGRWRRRGLVLLALIACGSAPSIYYGPLYFADVLTFTMEHALFLHSVSRYSKVSRARADMRSLATAIEAYYVDYEAFPIERPMRTFPNSEEPLRAIRGEALTTIEPGTPGSIAGITTPIAYITTIFIDPFVEWQAGPRKPRFYYHGKFFSYSIETKHAPLPFAYSRAGENNDGWIIFSPGPDKVYDIQDVRAVYNPNTTVPSVELINLTYDPTNGTPSAGDLWRVKQ